MPFLMWRRDRLWVGLERLEAKVARGFGRAARQEFAQAHHALSAETTNTSAIRSALSLVEPQWVFLDKALNKPALAGSKESLDIATTSERIYEQLDLIAGLYAQVGAKK